MLGDLKVIKSTMTKPGKKLRKPQVRQTSQSQEVRLNKYIANSGICSRREADEYIKAGLISINGKVVTQLGTKVLPADVVKYDGNLLKNEKKVYILMNKPRDYITTLEDPNAKKKVIDIIGTKCPERVYPVGRLDRNTTGILLLTNDGDLTRKLTHPSFNKKKIYHVFLDKNLARGDMNQISKGIDLEDGFIKPDAIEYVSESDRTQVGLEIHSGRNRIVRRMFEHFGYRVNKLDRVYYGGLTKKGLQRGQWRYLSEKEISILKSGRYE